MEYHPLGVIGAIVPFNYPFHNVFNPLTAALFAGNAIVIKVSEHASWSASYYKRIVDAALEACGAPVDLVQIVTGYAEAGNAVVTGGTDKVIFVGSVGVGKHVIRASADTMTPTVMELGGKDAFIVCEDADYDQCLGTGLRGAFQSCGQNCTGAERFVIHSSLVDRWLKDTSSVVARMRQGAPCGGQGLVDVGAMCLPGLAEKVQELIDDAVAKGARVVIGGKLPATRSSGQYYPPTIITDVNPSMRIWHEETFGPTMVVIPFETDDEAIAIANDCPFGLGSSVFCKSQVRENPPRGHAMYLPCTVYHNVPVLRQRILSLQSDAYLFTFYRSYFIYTIIYIDRKSVV